MKVCKVCGSSENGFLPRKASKDGLQFLCKICLKKQRKEWYFKNRSERLAYSKQWRKQHPESATMKWNANHPERMKEIRLASYQNNIESVSYTHLRAHET